MIEVLYLPPIAALCGCIYMTWRARAALNGLGRGLILLFLLLIVFCIDGALAYLDSVGELILTNTIVTVVAYDIFQIYKARDVYALYLINRRKRIDEYEAMRRQDELNQARRKWDSDDPVERYL